MENAALAWVRRSLANYTSDIDNFGMPKQGLNAQVGHPKGVGLRCVYL